MAGANSMQLVFEGPANLYRGFEGVGGKLTLSTDCLRFVPHAINIQKDKETILLADITRVEKTNTLGIIPNGLKVVTANGKYKFVVRKRNQWFTKINEQIRPL